MPLLQLRFSYIAVAVMPWMSDYIPSIYGYVSISLRDGLTKLFYQMGVRLKSTYSTPIFSQ